MSNLSSQYPYTYIYQLAAPYNDEWAASIPETEPVIQKHCNFQTNSLLLSKKSERSINWFWKHLKHSYRGLGITKD
ncbi:hypothetical protein [Scytonema sp. NUACC26]|uniref:hypothetical protein n=1 Tax=Scytonema sp. NUACC26 TaxID=3140176 RepID=UPI0034DC4D0E